MPPPVPSVYFPFIPPMNPWRMPKEPFEQIIDKDGITLYWMKGHTCACVYGNETTPGTAQQNCNTCHGRGIYWDQPIGPWKGLITFIHTSPTPDEPGVQMDTDQGLMVNGEPALTIPYVGYSSGFIQPSGIWQQAKIYDMFVESEATSYYTANLQVSGNVTLPYVQNVFVPPTGAVSVYDTTALVTVTGVPYTVSGVQVFLGSGYAAGTNYTVDFQAAPAYIAFRVAGMPAHVRPFESINFPRRFRLMTLDLWTRARSNGDIPYVPGAGG